MLIPNPKFISAYKRPCPLRYLTVLVSVKFLRSQQFPERSFLRRFRKSVPRKLCVHLLRTSTYRNGVETLLRALRKCQTRDVLD